MAAVASPMVPWNRAEMHAAVSPALRSARMARTMGRRSTTAGVARRDVERIVPVNGGIGDGIQRERRLALVARLHPSENERTDGVEPAAESMGHWRMDPFGDHLPHRREATLPDGPEDGELGTADFVHLLRPSGQPEPAARPHGWQPLPRRGEEGAVWPPSRSLLPWPPAPHRPRPPRPDRNRFRRTRRRSPDPRGRARPWHSRRGHGGAGLRS